RMFSDEQSKCFGDSASQWSTIALHNLAFGPHDFSGRSTGKILQWRRREVFWSSPLLTPRDRSKSDAAVSPGDKKHAQPDNLKTNKTLPLSITPNARPGTS